MVADVNAAVMISTSTVATIFVPGFIRGCHQISGSANGPTLASIRIMKAVRKYHGNGFPDLAGRGGG